MEFLDCTFRDGGFLNDWKWEASIVKKYCLAMKDLDINYLELDFLHKKNSSTISSFFRKNSELGILLRGLSNLSFLTNFREYQDKSDVDWLFPSLTYAKMLRVAARPQEAFQLMDLISTLRSVLKKQKLSIQLTHVSHYLFEDFLRVLRDLSSCDFDYLYLADSDGVLNFLKDKALVEELVLFKQKTGIKIGFHAHNNLELAFANCLICEQLGFDIIDGSLLGLGKGGGNLKTELWLMSKEKLKLDREQTFSFYGFLEECESSFPNKNNESIAHLSGFYNLYNEEVPRKGLIQAIRIIKENLKQ